MSTMEREPVSAAIVDEPELMYLMCSRIVTSVADLLACLDELTLTRGAA